MINQKTVLALIPARGGSKGVHRKNLRVVEGKPLIAWTINEAKKSIYIDRLILSSEDEEIIRVAKEFGCEAPFVRKTELSADDTPGILPVIDAIERIHNYDYVVVLQPTSPLRIVDDIDGCIRYCLENNANSCVSLCKTDKNPSWMFRFNEQEQIVPIIRDEEDLNVPRQKLQEIYELNGSVYIAKAEWLIKNKSFFSDSTIGYRMPIERSLDIDTEEDLNYFIFLKGLNLGEDTNLKVEKKDILREIK